MFKRRRKTPQLTPLLDLLIIVIFAQALALNDSVFELADTVEERDVQVGQLRVERNRQREERDEYRRRLNELEEELEEYKRQEEALLAELTELAEKLDLQDSVEERLQRAEDLEREALHILEAVADAFRVPEEVADAMTAHLNASEAEQIEARLEQLRDADPAEAVRHVRQMEEVKRQVDFWEIHITKSDEIRFASSGITYIENLYYTNREHTLHALRNVFSRLPAPKPLVLIIITRENCTVAAERAVLAGVEDFARDIRGRPDVHAAVHVSEWGYTESPP